MVGYFLWPGLPCWFFTRGVQSEERWIDHGMQYLVSCRTRLNRLVFVIDASRTVRRHSLPASVTGPGTFRHGRLSIPAAAIPIPVRTPPPVEFSSTADGFITRRCCCEQRRSGRPPSRISAIPRIWQALSAHQWLTLFFVLSGPC